MGEALNSDQVFQFLEKTPKENIDGHSVDCVVFGFDNNTLKILLLKWKGFDLWGLPGGFIQENENLEIAAIRILSERTRIDNIFLRQFYTFGNTNRRPANHIQLLTENLPESHPFVDWITKRFLTTGYFALVQLDQTSPTPDAFTDRCEWVDIKEIPELIFDHEDIVNAALEKMRIELDYLPVGVNLLPQKFTISQLQKLYETILGRKLDRANFQKKILKMDFLIRGEKLMTGKAHKAPYLYEFDEKAYNHLLSQGTRFI